MANVFITGASSGIGAELSKLYAARGDTLGLLALDDPHLAAAQEKARAAGAAKAHAYGADVREREAVRKAIRKFAEDAGGIDLFIASAGVDVDVTMDSYDSAKAEFVYDVNFRGLMYSANAALEVMLRQGRGHLAGIVSLSAWRILPLHADYSASKRAAESYLEALRIRLRDKPIRVTTVDPGFVCTPMTDKNSNPMPFRIEVDDAARRIQEGLDQRLDHFAFPLPLVLGAGLMRAMPDPLWRAVSRLFPK